MPATLITNPCHLPRSHVHPTTVTAPWGALDREGLATYTTAGHHFLALPSNYPPASPLACFHTRPSSLGEPDNVMAIDQRVSQVQMVIFCYRWAARTRPFVGVARLEKAGILCSCRRCVKRARALTSHNAHALFPVQLLVKHQRFTPAAGGQRRKCVDCRTVAVHGCRVAVAFLKAKGPPQAHAHIGKDGIIFLPVSWKD